jgi:hypothetical protein
MSAPLNTTEQRSTKSGSNLKVFSEEFIPKRELFQ